MAEVNQEVAANKPNKPAAAQEVQQCDDVADPAAEYMEVRATHRQRGLSHRGVYHTKQVLVCFLQLCSLHTVCFVYHWRLPCLPPCHHGAGVALSAAFRCALLAARPLLQPSLLTLLLRATTLMRRCMPPPRPWLLRALKGRKRTWLPRCVYNIARAPGQLKQQLRWLHASWQSADERSLALLALST